MTSLRIDSRCCRGLAAPSPPVGEGGASRSEATGEGLPQQTPLHVLAERTPHPALRATFSHKGRRERERHCVFATCVACVTNDVASSMAVPSGVGITMRNGTRMRVPTIGAKAISMLRWPARYLITGRSGI